MVYDGILLDYTAWKWDRHWIKLNEKLLVEPW
jgi:hypothetical protein